MNGGKVVWIFRGIIELEEENRRLKKMYAELSIDHSILREVLEKKI